MYYDTDHSFYRTPENTNEPEPNDAPEPDEATDDDVFTEAEEYLSPAPPRHPRRRLVLRIIVSVICIIFLSSVIIAGIYLAVNYDLRLSQGSRGAVVSLVPKGEPGVSSQSVLPDAEASGQTGSAVTSVRRASLGGASLTISPAKDGEELSNQDIFALCCPSIVSIDVVTQDGLASGTGIVMTEDGYIITNSHVIADALAITVTADEKEYEAALVGLDSQTDVAVLKLDAEGLTPAEFGDSHLVRVGDDVVAIGNPLGQTLTMTKGIISGIDRSVAANSYTMPMLQTSAQINTGNSGGALINMHGQVIGITNLKFSSSAVTVEGIGFAIPISSAKEIIDSLIEYGHVTGRPALGVTVRSVPSVAAAYYGTPAGVLVVSVSKNSDAYNQGLREGDLITQAQGVDIEESDQLKEIIAGLEVGDVIALTVYRDGETVSLGVSLVESAFVNTTIVEGEGEEED